MILESESLNDDFEEAKDYEAVQLARCKFMNEMREPYEMIREKPNMNCYEGILYRSYKREPNVKIPTVQCQSLIFSCIFLKFLVKLGAS